MSGPFGIMIQTIYAYIFSVCRRIYIQFLSNSI